MLMSNGVTRKIQIPSDRDGFITLQCPYCNDRFKLTVDFLEGECIIDLVCPYCGLKNEPNQFLREEVIEQVNVVARNLVVDIINQFSSNLERKISSNHIKFVANKPTDLEPEKLLYEQEELVVVRLVCCEVEAKVKDICQKIGIYCPQCGVK